MRRPAASDSSLQLPNSSACLGQPWPMGVWSGVQSCPRGVPLPREHPPHVVMMSIFCAPRLDSTCQRAMKGPIIFTSYPGASPYPWLPAGATYRKENGTDERPVSDEHPPYLYLKNHMQIPAGPVLTDRALPEARTPCICVLLQPR